MIQVEAHSHQLMSIVEMRLQELFTSSMEDAYTPDFAQDYAVRARRGNISIKVS